MATEIVGKLATSRLVGGEKFRVTWTRALAILPAWTFDAVGVSYKVQAWLPSVGAIPVSSPNAKAGDEVIVFDVRVAQSQGGRTVAQFLAGLEATPVLLSVTRLEWISPNVSSQELEQGQAEAVDSGNDRADTVGHVFDFLKDAGKVALTVLVVGGVVVAVYLARKR